MADKNYKVSILVPVYGVEKYIERCVVCLFEQTYETLEYIFVDDCSPDKSIEILNKVLKRYPQRKPQVTIIRHEHNRGLAAARNTAVAAATGEFLMHVDSDDYVDTDIIEKCVESQKENDSDIVTSDIIHLRPKVTYKHEATRFESSEQLTISILRGKTMHNIWGKLIRRSIYIDNKIKIEEGVNMTEDLQVFPKLTFFSKNTNIANGTYYYYNNTNRNSYVNVPFSEKKYSQSLRTYDLLEAFFKDKGIAYIEAFNEYRFISYVTNRIKAAEANNTEWFNKLSYFISEFDKSLRKKTTLPYRLSLIITSIVLLRLYAIIARRIKITLKK